MLLRCQGSSVSVLRGGVWSSEVKSQELKAQELQARNQPLVMPDTQTSCSGRRQQNLHKPAYSEKVLCKLLHEPKTTTLHTSRAQIKTQTSPTSLANWRPKSLQFPGAPRVPWQWMPSYIKSMKHGVNSMSFKADPLGPRKST